MRELVPGMLAAWVGVSLMLFWRLPGREAALITMIGGWTFLPVATFPESVFAALEGEGASMHALAIPTTILVNKATVIAIGCLAGSMIFDWTTLRRLRPSWLDLPLVIWCLTPVASSLLDGLGLGEGLMQSRYLWLTWGVPYGMGRAYLVDNESFRRFGLALAIAGLIYVPICLVEIVRGPSLYTLIYGPHPYQLTGASRTLLSRPMGWMECGNQLGMWMANAAVSAVWLWQAGRMTTPPRWMVGLLASGLVLVCVACQSLGSVVLMVVALIPIVLARLGFQSRSAYLTVTLVGMFGIAAAAVALGMGDRGRIKSVFQGVGKGSFTWRFGRYEENLPRAIERPILGWASADWSSKPDHKFVDPVGLGLWLPSLGMYGAIGLLASTALLTLPVIEVIKWLPVRSWLNPGCFAVSLAAVLLAINFLDALLNSVYLLPLLAASGGISSWSIRRYQGR